MSDALQPCGLFCLCDRPGSSVQGILQPRILEWIAIPFSRRSSLPGDWTCVSDVSCVGRQILYLAKCWINKGNEFFDSCWKWYKKVRYDTDEKEINMIITLYRNLLIVKMSKYFFWITEKRNYYSYFLFHQRKAKNGKAFNFSHLWSVVPQSFSYKDPFYFWAAV